MRAPWAPDHAAPVRWSTTWLVSMLVALVTVHAQAQEAPRRAVDIDPAQLVGTWTGTLDMQGLVSLHIEMRLAPPERLVARLWGAGGTEDEVEVAIAGPRLRLQSARFPIALDGWRSGEAIEAFVHYGQALFHTRLAPRTAASAPTSWAGHWSLTGVPETRAAVDLYVLEENANVFAAYLFFRDQRMPSLWTYGFECVGDTVRFREKNLGLEFEGGYDRDNDTMLLTTTALGGSTPVSLRRLTTQVMRHSDRFLPNGDLAGTLVARRNGTYREHAPDALADGWQTGTPSSQGIDPAQVTKLVNAIASGDVTLTHSILIARNATLVVEEYFYGFNRDTRHDMRSASKTIAAALVGAAIANGDIPSVKAPLLDYFAEHRQLANWDARKARITIHDALNMASGLDANDTDPKSVASENAYQSQTRQPDWMRLALDAPMIADPGTKPLYGSANPLLVGGVLHAAVHGSVEAFAHEYLFGPLGVENYKWFLDPTGKVYMGGGMYMRPRDMLKFGQLHLDGGTWNGNRILTRAWVQSSMAKYGRLGNVRDKNEYGYLWWHRDYTVGDQSYASIEARGAGGQYIFVVPALDLVAVVTSGNYRNGRFRQPEDIMERYILPAATQTSAQR